MTDLPPAPNGEPLTTDVVLDAMRERGLPPEPYRPRGVLRFVGKVGVVPPRQAPMLESLTGEAV